MAAVLDTTAARLEGLLERATKGELFVVPYGDGDSLVICADEAGNKRIAFMAIPGCRDHAARRKKWREIKANAELFVESRNALPSLLSERRALKDELERLREALEKRDEIERLEGWGSE